MQFFDTIGLGQAVEVTNLRETRNGSLVVNARAARGGNVQDYLGSEVGKPEIPIVRVYRDADEIFRLDSLKTFANKPVTLNHPQAPVTARTWKDVARGHTGEDVLRDGEFIRIPMMVSDQAAIDEVKGGVRELSMGYQCDLKWEPGTSPSGASYDAKQVNIIIDHVAIVPRGRAGPDCRIGDERPSDDGKTMRALASDETITPSAKIDRSPSMKTLVIDGHTVALDDAAFIAVSNTQKTLGTLTADNLRLTGDLNTLKADHASALSAKDVALADANKASETKDGEIAALKQQLKDAELTPAKLDAAVLARGKVVADARKIAGDKLVVDGKPDADIRREAVAARLGDAAKTLSDEAVNGAFLSLANDAKPVLDSLGRTISASLPTPGAPITNDADAAYREMCSQYDNAWKRQPQGNA